MIFYLIGTGVIDIIGVPHKQMDTPAYVGGVESQVSRARAPSWRLGPLRWTIP